jgi:hypothetical protein
MQLPLAPVSANAASVVFAIAVRPLGTIKCIPMPKYAAGDYIKVEFKNEDEPVGEWMWVRVDSCDDARRIVFGTLDNEPVMDSGGKCILVRSWPRKRPSASPESDWNSHEF